MTERSFRRLLGLLCTGLFVALGAVLFLLVRAQGRMDRLEEQVAGGGRAEANRLDRLEERAARANRAAPTPAAPPARVEGTTANRGGTPAAAEAGGGATGSPRRGRRADDDLHAPAQPKMPEARRFADENDLDELQWRTLTRLNQYWLDSLKKAEEAGEQALPDKLDYIAKQRDIKLRGVLGSDEAVTGYKAFESSLKADRRSFNSQDGTVYGAVPFE